MNPVDPLGAQRPSAARPLHAAHLSEPARTESDNSFAARVVGETSPEIDALPREKVQRAIEIEFQRSLGIAPTPDELTAVAAAIERFPDAGRLLARAIANDPHARNAVAGDS